MATPGGLARPLVVQDPHRGAQTVPAHNDKDDGDPPATSPTARWLFLDAYIETWFVHQQCVTTSTPMDLRFEYCLVHAPEVVLQEGIEGHRRRWKQVLYATELVVYMLELDKATRWYANRRKRPSVTIYDPSQFDTTDLVSTMTFLAHPLGVEDDSLDAIQRLHAVLLDKSPEDPAYEAYAAARQRIFETEDISGQLRSFKIPTHIKLQPPLPANADEIRAYLLDAIAFVRAFHYESDASAIPFYFEALTLSVYTDYLNDVRNELRELLSLGVPVTLSLRYNEMGWQIKRQWRMFQRPNMFSVVARDPRQFADNIGGNSHHDHATHSLESMWLSRACELWSAVAYSSTLRYVSSPLGDTDRIESISRWMAYALAHSTSLESLEIDVFQMNQEELDAFETVLLNPVPSTLLDEPPTDPVPLQLIRVRPDAIVNTSEWGSLSNAFLTLDQLQIPSDWQFPVIQTIEETQTIQFIVPGHAICATSLASVAFYHDVPNPPRPRGPRLRSLVIYSNADSPGDVGRFVELVGHELRALNWKGQNRAFANGDNMQPDLDAIVRACPHLETLAMDHTNFDTLVPLTSLRLCELQLDDTVVTMAELTAFFRLLGDETTPLAQTLERLTFLSRIDAPLTQEAVDAAFEMLSVNRRLHSVSLGLDGELVDAADVQFEPLRFVSLGKEPLSTKLAFLSVVQQYGTQQPLHPLGKLDQGCVTNVLRYLGRVATRRIQFTRCDENA